MPVDIEPSGDRISVNGEDVALVSDIESGSNENGNWIKYPDGTMIQYGDVAKDLSGSWTNRTSFSYLMLNDTIAFPLSFIAEPYAQVISNDFQVGERSAYIVSVTNVTETGIGSYSLVTPDESHTATNKAINIKWQAIGRWK